MLSKVHWPWSCQSQTFLSPFVTCVHSFDYIHLCCSAMAHCEVYCTLALKAGCLSPGLQSFWSFAMVGHLYIGFGRTCRLPMWPNLANLGVLAEHLPHRGIFLSYHVCEQFPEKTEGVMVHAPLLALLECFRQRALVHYMFEMKIANSSKSWDQRQTMARMFRQCRCQWLAECLLWRQSD